MNKLPFKIMGNCSMNNSSFKLFSNFVWKIQRNFRFFEKNASHFTQTASIFKKSNSNDRKNSYLSEFTKIFSHFLVFEKYFTLSEAGVDWSITTKTKCGTYGLHCSLNAAHQKTKILSSKSPGFFPIWNFSWNEGLVIKKLSICEILTFQTFSHNSRLKSKLEVRIKSPNKSKHCLDQIQFFVPI